MPLSPRGRTRNGKALDVKTGARTLIRHRSFVPQSSVTLTLVGSSEHTCRINRTKIHNTITLKVYSPTKHIAIKNNNNSNDHKVQYQHHARC